MSPSNEFAALVFRNSSFFFFFLPLLACDLRNDLFLFEPCLFFRLLLLLSVSAFKPASEKVVVSSPTSVGVVVAIVVVVVAEAGAGGVEASLPLLVILAVDVVETFLGITVSKKETSF